MCKKFVIALVAAIGLIAVWQTNAEAQCLSWRTIAGSSTCVAWKTKGVQCEVKFDEGCFVTGEGKGEAFSFEACQVTCSARNTDPPTSIAFCTTPRGIVGVPCDEPFSFGPVVVGFQSSFECVEHEDNESTQGELHERHKCKASATLPPGPENISSCTTCCAHANPTFTCAGDLTPVEMTARIDAVYFGGATSVTSCAPGSAECTVEETCSINPKKINFIPPDKPQLGKPYQCNIDCVGPACNID